MRSCLEEQSLPVSPEERAAGAFRNAMILPGKDVNSSFASFYLEFFEENHRWKETDGSCNLFCVTEALGSVCGALGNLLPFCARTFSLSEISRILHPPPSFAIAQCKHLSLLGRFQWCPDWPYLLYEFLSRILGKWGAVVAERGRMNSGWVSVSRSGVQ